MKPVMSDEEIGKGIRSACTSTLDEMLGNGRVEESTRGCQLAMTFELHEKGWQLKGHPILSYHRRGDIVIATMNSYGFEVVAPVSENGIAEVVRKNSDGDVIEQSSITWQLDCQAIITLQVGDEGTDKASLTGEVNLVSASRQDR